MMTRWGGLRYVMATIIHYTEATANDSDKTYTTTQAAYLRFLRVEFTATATVGTRTLDLVIKDPDGGTLFSGAIDASIVASASETHLVWPSAAASLEIPLLPLQKGSTIRVYDSAAIDAAADDMTVRILLEGTPR